MALQMRGVTGELKFGYQRVARLQDWHIASDGRLTATPADVNTFWAAQGSGQLSVALRVGTRQWIWSTCTVDRLDAERVEIVLHGSPQAR